jgi:hypothetical protein
MACLFRHRLARCGSSGNGSDARTASPRVQLKMACLFEDYRLIQLRPAGAATNIIMEEGGDC